MKSDSLYILWRRIKGLAFTALFYLMRIFPIKKGKIVFATFEGDGGYCCNPRYIADELLRRGRDYEMVWLLHDVTKTFPEGITPVKDTVWNIVYHLSTAEVWIDNYRKPYGTKKRNGQLYIQTWHASLGFKAVGGFRGALLPKIARLVSEADSGMIDYVVSNSDYCTSIYPTKLFYNGPVIQSGSPRCDCLLNGREKFYRQIRARKQLPQQTKILLYAPTFRGGTQATQKQVFVTKQSLDFVKLKGAIEKKWSGDWVIFLRLHPQLAAILHKMPTDSVYDWMIDVSADDDMSELLAASDMLVTDYSSCAFDAAFAGIPVLLYADDIEEYKYDRGQFMWKQNELPFCLAKNDEELFENIMNFDAEKYRMKTEAFMKCHAIVEDGYASRRVANVIEAFVKQQRQGGNNGRI